MRIKTIVYLLRRYFICLLLFCSFYTAKAQAQQKVMLLGFYGGKYNDGTTINTTSTGSVPCPADPYSFPATGTWFYDQLAKEANLIAASGFTSVWLPPMAKGLSGNGHGQISGINDAGYGVFDQYDLGDKFQASTYQTRYGSRTQLTRCVAMFRANGIDAYEDFVTNQLSIFANVTPVAPTYLWYQYKDAFGNAGGGRFPKYTPDFHNPPSGKPGAPGGTADPDEPATTYPDGSLIPGNPKEGFFGPDFAHITGERNINGYPGVWCATQLSLWGDWLIKATGIQGYRLDDASGISWDFLKPFVNYGAMKGKFSVTELAGSVYGCSQLKAWMQTSMGKTDSNFTMFDQVLQGAMGALCKTDHFYTHALMSQSLGYGATNEINPAAGTVNPGNLDIYRSLMVTDPSQAVTVVNEIDSETGTNPVLPKECLLGYAYIMTIGFGIPCVAYRDWSTDTGSYGSIMIDGHNLNYHLNKLIWCHNFIISGGLTNEFSPGSGHVYGFQKTGGKQAIVLLSSDRETADPVTMPTTIPNGTVLTDYTDHNVTATVTNGTLSVTVPANVNGRGYLVMAPPGITGTFSPKSSSVTQEWDGAEDLSIPPASSSQQEVCRIWVGDNQNISTTLLSYNTNKWNSGTKLNVEIDRSSLDNKTNIPLTSRSYLVSQQNQTLSYTTPHDGPGYYSIWVSGSNLPDATSNWWFNLQNTYTASQTASQDFNDTVATLTGAVKPIVIPDEGSNSLKLYPNPAQNSLTAEITLTNSATVSLQVFNMNGHVVYGPIQMLLPSGTHSRTMDISGLQNGPYLLQFQTTAGQIFTKEFMKQ